MAAVPFGATPNDTAEFLLGRVHVNVVFLESTGQIDPSTENWTSTQRETVKQRVIDGVSWWKDLLEDQNSVHELDFHFDFTYADNPFPTAYEPIARVSQDFRLWVREFLDHTGFGNLGTGDAGVSDGVRAYNHAQRVESGSHWGFTIFVVNAENDADGRFAAGSDFSRAFAFAGGRFYVVPSTRPASTYAHELGHIFYALDEHSGGASYHARRGYYNTQNLNAVSQNPNPASRVPSIMDSHDAAGVFPQRLISQSAKEMVGWRDSDGDGIFDVLDVPLSLTGSGALDPATGQYRFVGQASVGTLRNLNQSSLQSDITINQVSRVQYRIDGGAWTTIVAPHAYRADLDFSFAVPAGEHTIEIRALDGATNQPGETGVMSAIFRGTTAAPVATTEPGLNGFLWNDADGDGVRDANEAALAGWTVAVRDAAGKPLATSRRVEPDQFASDQNVARATPGVTLTAPIDFHNPTLPTDDAFVRTASAASTGTKAFAYRDLPTGPPVWSTSWKSAERQLVMTFDAPVTSVSIDAVGAAAGSYGRLEIYDAERRLLARTFSDPLAAGEAATLTLRRPTAEIAYAVATGHGGTAVLLDNLRFGPEATAVTDANGAWSLPALDRGEFQVHAAPPVGWVATSPSGGVQAVTLAAGATVQDVTLGFRFTDPRWLNARLPADVNGDGEVTVRDLLAVVDFLRRNGSGPIHGEPEPGDPRVDVDGNHLVSVKDLLEVVTALRAQLFAQQGEGETGLAAEAPPGSASQPAIAEAESPAVAFPAASRAAPPRDAEASITRERQPDGAAQGHPRDPSSADADRASATTGAETDRGAVADFIKRRRWDATLDDSLTLIADDVAHAWHHEGCDH